MKVFITGVAGFLGSHLAEWFLKNGHEVAGNDNLIGGDMENVPEGIAFTLCDICDLDAMTNAMKGAEVVYHCAAMAYEGVSVFAPATITNNIMTGSATVFSAAIRSGVRRIINCSSMARYGAGHAPFLENAECFPQDPYGIAKKAAEDLLRNLGETHGFEWTTAVPHNIYGTRQRYVDPYRNVASIMANLMLQGRQPVIYGDGEQMRCFSYVDDSLACLVKMADSPKVLRETINIGPDEETVTINTLFQRLSNITGFNGEAIYMPGRPQEVFHATCSADKARLLLDYKTSTTLDDGLRKLVEWMREKGPKPFAYHFDLEFITERTPKTWTERLF
jgi:UDP-glucose 4-epimerase